jgi:histidinol dehydrogenase
MSRIDLRNRALGAAQLRAALPRGGVDVEEVVPKVRPIIDAIAERGAAAALDYGESFDGVRPTTVRVPADELDAALADLDVDVRAALQVAIDRARKVHADQRRTDTTTTLGPGATVTERWVPVERVGLYVPGGNAVYPSSVVMNVVPAQVAGVRSLAVTSPPRAEHRGEPWGLPHPSILAACALLGVDEVYAVGGAQAVAMFAYGTEECPPADLVTGPGNVYVAAAKRLLKGVIGIDSEAGPTEIGILADDTADPAFLAADLIAQAEHDANASCLLVTPSAGLLDAVDAELVPQLAATKHRERVTAALTQQSAYALVDDLEQGVAVVDEWAAEHLEVITADAREWAAKVTNAGAIFVGPYAPVSLGDYLAGSNHVLPTGGTARHSGGLSVQSFLRGIHVVDYDRAALAAAAPHIDALGAAEDLVAHAAAVRVRVPRDERA